MHAQVVVLVGRNQVACGQWDLVERDSRGLGSAAEVACGIARDEAFEGAWTFPCGEGIDEQRDRVFAVAECDGVDGGTKERRGMDCGGMSTEEHEDARVVGLHGGGYGECGVRVDGVDTGDADDGRTGALQCGFEGGAEAQVDEVDVMAVGAEGGGDVLEAEGFDAEEGAKAKAVVGGDGAYEEHAHEGVLGGAVSATSRGGWWRSS